MRKSFFVIILLFMTIVCGCSSRTVSEKQIIEDLKIEFAENNYIIEDISIDLHSKDKKHNVIELTANIKSDVAKIIRMYRLSYDYYEVGGWVLNNCQEIKRELWSASPLTTEISNEVICNSLFCKYDEGEYFINDIVKNEHFEDWTIGSPTKYIVTDFLEKVEYDSSNIENGNVTLIAHCKANSSLLEIYESFKMHFKFNSTSLTWDVESAEAIDYSYKFIEDITGRYIDSENWGRKTLEVTISKVGETHLISGDSPYDTKYLFNHSEIKLNGLFDVYASSTSMDGKYVFSSGLSFYPESGELIFTGNIYDSWKHKFLRE